MCFFYVNKVFSGDSFLKRKAILEPKNEEVRVKKKTSSHRQRLICLVR